MKRIILNILFILLAIIEFSFATNFKIIARVNDDIITQYDLENYSNLLKVYFKEEQVINSQIKKEILDSLIQNTLKKQAIKNDNVQFDQEEFNYYIESIVNDKETNNKLKKYKVGKELYNDFLKDNFMWSKLIDTKIKPRISINNSEIDDSLEYLIDNAVRTRYNISQITIYKNQNSDPKNIVDKLYEEIKEKNNFESMAEKFSQDNKKDKGYIGWVDEMDINEGIYDAIKNLQVGFTTKPLYFGDSDSGYYLIIKLNNKKEEKIAKNDEISRVQYVIYGQKLNIEIKNYLNNLYNNALIELY